MSMKPKPSSKFSIFTFLLLLCFLTVVVRSSDVESNEAAGSEEELDDLEQLLAVDEQLQEEQPEQQTEAETVSKAQRIVLELNGDNTKRLIDGNEYVMVLGYAPWCARSAELMPRFAEAATGLKEMGSSVLMAKIDGERYSKVASQLEIKGFPTLLLFVNGTSQPYTGGFSSEDIVIWVQKKTGAPTIKLNTADEASWFLKKYHTFILGLFEKSEGSSGHDEFVKAATLDNEIQFVETSSSDVAKLLFPNLETNNVFLGMVKNEAERYTAYDGPYQTKRILEFLNSNKFPLITKLTESNTVRVYSSPVKLQVMVFSKTDDFETLAQPLENIARKFKSKLMFIYIDVSNENLAMPFLTLFGIEDAKKTVATEMDRRENLYGVGSFKESLLRGKHKKPEDFSGFVAMQEQLKEAQRNIEEQGSREANHARVANEQKEKIEYLSLVEHYLRKSDPQFIDFVQTHRTAANTYGRPPPTTSTT